MLRDNFPVDVFANRLRNEASVERKIFTSVIDACPRIATLRKAGRANRLDQLLTNAAWTDAALTVISMELPTWTVRRLAYEDGKWVCSLSHQANLPSVLDDTVDFNHSVLPLAILGAVIEARARAYTCLPLAQSEPQIKAQPEHVFCCDNFA